MVLAFSLRAQICFCCVLFNICAQNVQGQYISREPTDIFFFFMCILECDWTRVTMLYSFMCTYLLAITKHITDSDVLVWMLGRVVFLQKLALNTLRMFFFVSFVFLFLPFISSSFFSCCTLCFVIFTVQPNVLGVHTGTHSINNTHQLNTN